MLAMLALQKLFSPMHNVLNQEVVSNRKIQYLPTEYSVIGEWWEFEFVYRGLFFTLSIKILRRFYLWEDGVIFPNSPSQYN